MTDKKTIKRLKRLDAFQERFFAIGQWVTANLRQISFVAAPLVVIAVGFFCWRLYQQHQGEILREELAVITDQFKKEEDEAGKKHTAIQQEIEKLDAAIEAEKAKDPKATGTPAENKALEDKKNQLIAIKADHKVTLEQFQAFYKKYQGNAEGWRAGMFAVKILLDNKQPKEAADLLSPILQQSKGVDFYQIQGRTLYISALTDSKAYDLALQETDKLLEMVKDDSKARVLLLKGKLLLQADKKAEAQKTFAQIINDFNSSPEARKAQGLLAL